MNAKRKLLIVGAGGFVGPWLARAATAAGWSVSGLTRREAATTDLPDYRPLVADAADARCRDWVDEADAVVFNLAYIPANASSAAEAAACLQANSLLLLTYLDWICARPRPLVYISGGQGYHTDRELASEKDPLFPSGPAVFYLGSKLLGDLYAEHYREVRDLPVTILRAGSLYGPGQKRGMVARFVTQARSNEKIVLQDGGRHKADLTFVADVGQTMVAALDRCALGIFNVGSGKATSALDAGTLILDALGKSTEMLEVKPGTSTVLPKGFAALDVTRARVELGFVPTAPEAGLRRTVAGWH